MNKYLIRKHSTYFWHDLLEHYDEQCTQTYHYNVGSKPHPSESGHKGEVDEE